MTRRLLASIWASSTSLRGAPTAIRSRMWICSRLNAWRSMLQRPPTSGFGLVSIASSSPVRRLTYWPRPGVSETLAAANQAAALQAAAIERGAEQYVLGILTDQGEDARR